MGAMKRWFKQMCADYENERDDAFMNRITSAWRATGDQNALLFEAVQHLAAIRAALEGKNKRGGSR